MLKSRPGVVEAATNKVVQSVACQKIARAAMDFGGTEALVSGVRAELRWRQSMWETIGGGTSEIMRGGVAKQELGLGGRSRRRERRTCLAEDHRQQMRRPISIA